MNLGSKFNRVKQQADRLFLRGDKTDVIGELRYAEDQAEELRILCEAFSKSLERRINTHMVTEEKKYRKVPENQAAEVLKEALREVSQNHEDFSDQPLFKTIIEETVGVEQHLGKGVLDYEDNLEIEVLSPFHKLLKEDFPSIAKQKKALKQAGQDVDSAKAKVRSASVSTTQPNKLETYREELDEAELKLEQMRDTYACDLFSILRKQKELARLAHLYLELKADYLAKSLERLNSILPSIRKVYDESCCSPVYGVPLYEHLRVTKQEIAVPVQMCVKRMIEFGVYEEGLLRMAGSNNKIKRLKGLFDAGIITVDVTLDDYYKDYDVHVVSGVFKSYLRELPEPLLTHTKHDEFIEAVRTPDHKEKLRHIWQVINALPTQNYNNLRYVIKFLALLASYSNENKMTPNNIAIVMAPNLIGSHVENNEILTMGRNMTLGNDYRVLIEQLIEYSDYFFKGDLDFGVHPRRPEPPPSPRMSSGMSANGVPLARTESHRRTGSADFNVGNQQMIQMENESPKQPHRMKKKPAPLPPQGKSFIEETGLQIPSPIHTVDTTLSKSPPTNAFPHPAPRLHHTNSLKRPTVGPPKPPGGTATPVKPPRPSPPILSTDTIESKDSKYPSRHSSPAKKNEDNEAKRETIPSPPIGFENIESRNLDIVDSTCVETFTPANESSAYDKTEAIQVPLGFSIENKETCSTNISPSKSKEKSSFEDLFGEPELRGNKGISDPEFRKSLEGVLKNQPQHSQSRHLLRNSYTSEPSVADSKSEEKAPVLLPVIPVPAQRTTFEKADSPAVPRFEKPAVPEKPSAISRSMVASDTNRLVSHERPIVVNAKNLQSNSQTQETDFVEDKKGCIIEPAETPSSTPNKFTKL